MAVKTYSFNPRTLEDKRSNDKLGASGAFEAADEAGPAHVKGVLADQCFDAMVRHSQRQKTHEQAVPRTQEVRDAFGQGEGVGKTSFEAEARQDSDLAWGASEVAALIFGSSRDPAENRRRRRRVFKMFEDYKKALADARENKRPAPANPGWVMLPRCARIVLSKAAYRDFIAAQLEGKR